MPNATATRIYNGSTVTGGENVTDAFSSSSFLYLISPDTIDDFEVDAYLNVVLGSEVRKIPFGSYHINTRDIIEIPSGFRNSGLEMRLILVTDKSVNLEVWEITTDCCGEEQLDSIETKINLIGIGQAATLANQLAQDLALETLAVGLGAALLPYTAGASAAIPAAVTPILAPAIVGLSTLPVLVGFP